MNDCAAYEEDEQTEICVSPVGYETKLLSEISFNTRESEISS